LKKAKLAIQVTVPFALGIVLSEILQVAQVIAMGLWLTSCLALLVANNASKGVFAARHFTGSLFILAFFFSGMFYVTFQQVENQSNHFSNHFLPGNQLVGRVVEMQEGKGSFDRVLLETQSLLSPLNIQTVNGKLLVHVKKEDSRQTIEVGDVLQVAAEVKPIQNANNPGEFNQENFMRFKGIRHYAFIYPTQWEKIDHAAGVMSFWANQRNRMKEKLNELLPPNQAALATALSLGDKSLLDRATRASFANAGAMHVLAVSGLHVGILLFIIQWIFSKVPFLRKRNRFIIAALLLIWCFAFLTGLSASVVRAAGMFSIMGIGQLMGRNFFSFNSLFASAFILLLFQPYFIFDIGFQLSYLAMFGILMFYAPVAAVFNFKWKVLRYFWEGTAIGIAAQIGTLPISLYYFHQFPNYFMLTNIGLMILAGVALGAVLLIFILAFVPYLNEWIAFGVKWVFWTLENFVVAIAELPRSVSFGFTPFVWLVLVAYLCVFLFYHSRMQKNWKIWRNTAIVALFLAVLNLGQKMNNLSGEELLVLNHRQLAVLWKVDNHVICLYENNQPTTAEQVSFPAEAYAKKLGLHVTYFPMPSPDEFQNSQKLKVGESTLKVASFWNGYLISKADSKYWLAKKGNRRWKDCVHIGGAWAPYLAKEMDINTLNGAVRL
jgi:competence protein ComEC